MPTLRPFARFSRRMMASKRRIPKLTAEELAERAELRRRPRERNAERERIEQLTEKRAASKG
jgi:hypothetical protein